MPQQAQSSPNPLAAYGVVATPAPAQSDNPLASFGTPATPVAAAATPPKQPGVISRGVQSLVNNTPLALIKPPETPTEQVVHATGGDSGLAAYRAAKGLVGTVESVVKAGPESYANAVKDYQRMHQEFINKDYRNAASSAGSLALDAAGVVDPTAAAGTQHARNLTEGARPGADLATPLTADVVNGGLALVGTPEGRSGISDAAESASRIRVNPFRARIARAAASPAEAGEAAAQGVVQPGVRAVAPPVGASFRSGIDFTTPLAEAKNVYAAADKAAPGVNFKGLADRLDAALDRERLTAPGSPEQAKALADVDASEKAMNDARQTASKSNVDLDKTLKAADAKFTEAQANKDLNSKFFGKAVEGNVAHGAPESINVDQGIKILEDLDKPNKYGASRLQQTSLGKDGAFKLKQVLYDAQKAGKKAVNALSLIHI